MLDILDVLFEDINKSVLTDDQLFDCPPSLMNPSEVGKSIHDKDNSSYEEILDTAKKYYASQLLNIDPSDARQALVLCQVDSELSASEVQQINILSENVHKLLKLNDLCDKNGIKYLAGIIKILDTCPKDQVNTPKVSEFISYLNHSERPLAQKVREFIK